MIFLSLLKKKRVSTLLGVMFAGVVFAGFVSSVLATPVSANKYLHDHLSQNVNTSDMIWAEEDGKLSDQNRSILTSLVLDTDRPDWTASSDMSVTGQALATATDSSCSEKPEFCELTIRVRREFNEDHTNRDFRVTNVTENSQRVTFKFTPDLSDLTLSETAKETRLFRFYQTQTGWTQKTSEILVSEEMKPENRDGQFADRFSSGFVGVNYYPASASWKAFWTAFPIEEITSDLEIIESMNANSVRIFIHHEYFDSDETKSEAQAKLRVFLDLCAEKNISVLVTLFDLRPEYTVFNLEQDIGHIDQVLSNVSDHPAILGIDIKNQADLDFEGWGRGRVEGWLTVMAQHIQLTYPDIPVTVGWSKPTEATGLLEVVDFVTYHEYSDPKGFDIRLAEVKAKAGEKPVMITELGSTVWTPFRTTKSAEKKQASRLEDQLRHALNSDGVFVWTLHDFDHVGSEVVGWRPWRKAQQKHFGLIRSDGSARPAKNIFQLYADTRSPQSTKQARASN